MIEFFNSQLYPLQFSISPATALVYGLVLSAVAALFYYILHRNYNSFFNAFLFRINPEKEGILLIDRKFRITKESSQLAELLGFTSLKGKPVSLILDEDSFRSINSREHQAPFSVPVRLVDKNGLPVQSTLTMIPLKKIFVSKSVYILELPVREEFSQDHSAMFDESISNRNQLILNFAGEGIIGLNLKGEVVFLNLAAAKILGYNNEEVSYRNIRDVLNYNVLDYDILTYQIMETTPVAYDVEPRLFKEFEFTRKDGTVIPIEFIIRAVKNGDELLGSVLVIKDITERRKTEEKLELASRVFEHISEGIIVTDDKQIIQSVNPAFSSITGYPPNEIVGRNPGTIRSGLHDEEFYKLMWDALKEKGTWEGEIWNKRKNGEVYPERLIINTVKDKWGKVINYIGIFNDITTRKRSEDLMKYHATHDSLTGLYNRNFFHTIVKQQIKNSTARHFRFALLFIDLDGFKIINDTMGHEWGDVMLKEVSERISNQIRSEDTLARIGGDEFIIYYSEAATRESIEGFARRVIQSVSAPYSLGSEMKTIGASIGISIFPDDTESEDELIRLADIAMYHIKRTGKNNFIFYGDLFQKEKHEK